MSRPEKFEDLPSFAQEGKSIASVSLGQIGCVPREVSNLMLDLLSVSAKHGLIVDAVHGSVRKEITLEQMESRLRDAQERWDEIHRECEEFIKNPPKLPSWQRHTYDRHVDREGMTPIPWPDDE